MRLVDILDHRCSALCASLAHVGVFELRRPRGAKIIVSADAAELVTLIVGEAVSNAIRYSHPTGVPGKIAVTCWQESNGAVQVAVADDGIGLPEGFDPTSDGHVGFEMMRALSARLGAKLSFKSTALGLRVSLRLPPKARTGARAVAPDGWGGEPMLQNGSAKDGGFLESLGVDGAAPHREVLELLPAAIYMTDAEGRITFYNDAAAEFWGCRPEIGKSEFCGSWKLYRPDGTPLPHAECPMAVALREKRPIRGVEAVAERPDGTRVPFLPYPTPVFDSAGALTGAINVLVDITERKQAELRLEKLNRVTASFAGELDFERIAQAVTDGATELSGAAFGAFFSRETNGRGDGARLCALFGISREAFEALDLARNAALFAPVMRGTVVRSDDVRKDPRLGDMGNGGREGRPAVVSYLALPIVSPTGEVNGGLFFGHHKAGVFTEEVESILKGIAAQVATVMDNCRLFQASVRLGAIVETSQDAIVSKDLNGIVTSWNKGAEHLFGYSAAEMIGRSILTIIPPERQDEEPAILRRVGAGERVEPYETVRVRKDGSLVEVALTVSPIKDMYGRVIGASKIARNITERKQTQARQELMTRELHHRTKNLFAVVQAVVSRSFVGRRTAKEAEAAVLGRLRSLAQTHEMLVGTHWQAAGLAEIVQKEMLPYSNRVEVEGPPVALNAKAAQNFSLALHELATNAAKYGAFSNATGRAQIRWSVARSENGEVFRFSWREQDGPRVTTPSRRGFGTAVLEQVMADHVNDPPSIKFDAGGVRYEITCSLEALTAPEESVFPLTSETGRRSPVA